MKVSVAMVNPDVGHLSTNSPIKVFSNQNFSCAKPLFNGISTEMEKSNALLISNNYTLKHNYGDGYNWTVMDCDRFKTGRRLFTWRQTTMQGCPGISILSWVLLTSVSLHFLRNDVKKSEKENGDFGCVQCCQSGFLNVFQASSRRVFMESYKMQE